MRKTHSVVQEFKEICKKDGLTEEEMTAKDAADLDAEIG